MSETTEVESADVLDEIEAAIRSGRSMGLGAWAILNRVQRLATPTPARSEAAGGEEAESMEAYRIDRLLADWREGIAETEAIGGRPDWVRSVTLRDMKRIVAEITSLRQQLAAAERERNALHGELAEVGASIRTTEFMDPPDGGDVSLAEQVRRMRAALDAAREDLREALGVVEDEACHDPSCATYADGPCDCGLDPARTEPAREGEGGENG